MSGYQRPRATQAVPPLRLPRLQGSSEAANINQAFASIEAADAQNVKRNQVAVFPAVMLTAPDGTTWQLAADTGGIIRVTQVPARPPPPPTR